MQMNTIIRIAEKPARLIHRRWPRSIGPYVWPEYFVKEHYYQKKRVGNLVIQVQFDNAQAATLTTRAG